MRSQIRPVTLDDDLSQDLDLGHRAFGPASAADRDQRLTRVRTAVTAGRVLGAFDGPQLLASALYHEMSQWWAGRAVPMAGVGGVKVAPEARGQGIGRALVSELLRIIAARGFALSTLYPATLPLYRSLGWELAGGRYRHSLPARAAYALAEPDRGRAVSPPPLRRPGPADVDKVNAVISGVHEANRDCGAATFDAGGVERELSDESVFCYLAPDGYLAYQWAADGAEMHVRRLLAVSAATTRALWSVVGSHASMTRTIRAWTGPADPVGWLTREPDVSLERAGLPWMLRAVSAAAAIAGRGFPPAVQLTVALELTDAALSGNSGRWLLRVEGGSGTLEPAGPAAGPAPLRLGPRGLAALYAGTTVSLLRRSGLADGGHPDADAVLDSAFAAAPFMLDQF